MNKSTYQFEEPSNKNKKKVYICFDIRSTFVNKKNKKQGADTIDKLLCCHLRMTDAETLPLLTSTSGQASHSGRIGFMGILIHLLLKYNKALNKVVVSRSLWVCLNSVALKFDLIEMLKVLNVTSYKRQKR